MRNKIIVLLNLITFFAITFSIYAQEVQNQRQLGQPVLMALPSSTDGKDPLTLYQEDKQIQAAATAINQVLTERQLEVRDLKQQITNFDRLRSKMTSLQGDPNAMIAASVGADIYLEFALEIIQEGPGIKARVDINVKEAATAKLLGASSGQSDAILTSDISSLCQIAVNNCIDRIMEQIRGYWTTIPQNGKPIIITISSTQMKINQPVNNGIRIDRDITKILKENTISYRREMSTENTLQFNPVYIDFVKFDDVEEFSNLLQDYFEKIGIKYNPQIEGKSIEITIN
jgi:Family of unknown function (DUF6175)